jgi:hypothetical protein
LDKLPYPPSVREGFKKFKKDLLAIDLIKRANELNNVPFSDFMKGYPAEVKQWWDNYGPSNWGAATEDTAAAMGIGEMQEIGGETVPDFYTWPGGLGAITKRLADILQPKYAERMQAGATTVAVVPDDKEVQVTYMQGAELKTVAAKTVIMATPKFITRRLVQGLPEKQSDAMHQIRYIPYAVVNLSLTSRYLTRATTRGVPETRLPISSWRIGPSATNPATSKNTTSSPAMLR